MLIRARHQRRWNGTQRTGVIGHKGSQLLYSGSAKLSRYAKKETKLRAIKYNIQYPNFDAQDFGETTYAKLENKVMSFDWSKYLMEGEKLQETTGDSCPASFHLTDGKYLFSIANTSPKEFVVMASVPKKQINFLFLKLGSSSKTVEHFPLTLENSLELLKAYFNSEFDIIEHYNK